MHSNFLRLCLVLSLATACSSATIASQLKGVPHETLSQQHGATYVRLDAAATVGGFEFPAGTVVNFYESEFKGATLVNPLTVSGVTYPANSHLAFIDGQVTLAELAGNVTIGANTFGDGDVLTFIRQESMVMLSAVLGADREVGGTAYTAGYRLIFGPTGQLLSKESSNEASSRHLREARDRRAAAAARRAQDETRSQCIAASKCDSLSTVDEKYACKQRCR